MIKKIIIGIAITAFLVFGSVGSIYAYQKEQPDKDTVNMDMGEDAISMAYSGLKGTATQPASNKNNDDCQGIENKYQHNNNFSNNEDNNCEQEKNNYSWQHKYNYQNENCNDGNCQEYNHNNSHSHSYQNLNSENKGNFSLRQNRNNRQ